ncbi:MAG: N-6 DNA methylase [Bacteroidetes bacterium]|nr:N-6 DNA methylase [Bacteroidota bacterium]
MANERKTESIVQSLLRRVGYCDDHGIHVEQQRSDNPRISRLLKRASKQGSGAGMPDFIVSSETYSDFLIVIECKANELKHKSKSGDRYADYAVDGALFYAKFLAREYDVLAIAVSGETISKLRISHYLHLQSYSSAEEFCTVTDRLLPFAEYREKILHSDSKVRQDYNVLLAYSLSLNDTLQGEKIKEAHRGLLICAILVALRSRAFKKSFVEHETAPQLADDLVNTVLNQFQSSGLDHNKVQKLEGAFSFIRHNTTLTGNKDFFIDLIQQIDEKINTFIQTHRYYDALGQFYVQFLRYANNDKGLGIVLTPPHIAELFAELADVNSNSIVYDNCCGTGGLLIASMKKMLGNGSVSREIEQNIKQQQLIGTEFQDDIYALAVSNMVIHGDGKTNIFLGNCFDLIDKVKNRYSPNVGLLNPPYKTKTSTIEELEFVLDNLSALDVGGKCVAILPMSCVITDSVISENLKEQILEHHTLEAVMSMPLQLFHDSKAGVVTCVLVVTAHQPHPAEKKTWFGYWRDDGYEIAKPRGRVDTNDRWNEIKAKWLSAYRNREEIKGLSVTAKVGSSDEWCAEAYMETDYSSIGREDFEVEVNKYVAYRILNEI